MGKTTVKASTASRSEYVYIQDSTSTTGAGLTGLVFNSAGLTAYYVTERGTPTSITLVTLASATAAYSSGGFVAVDATNMPGLYRIDIPTAVFTGNKAIVYLKGATSMVPCVLEYEVVAFDPQDTVRLGLTAMPNVASGGAGAIITAGTGTAQLSVTSGLVTAGTVNDKTGYSLSASQTFNTTGSVGSVTGAVGSVTGAVGSFSTTAIQSIWDRLTSNLTTASSVGKLIVDNLNATVSSRSTLAAVDVWSYGTRTITGGTITTNSDKTGYSLATAPPTAAEVWTYGTRTLTSGGGGGGSTVALRMGPYSFGTPDTRVGEPISTMVGAAHAVEFQLLDALGNAVDTTGATVTAKVYSLAGTLLDTYTATSIYDAAGRGYFTLDSTVTGTAGTYRVTITRSTGLTDVTVCGPVTLYVREV